MKAVLISFVAVGLIAFVELASAQTWTQTSAPNTNWQFVAASADGTKLVALNNLYGIYASTNSGSTWQKATNGPVLTAATQWSSLAGSADGSKWVATAYYSPAAPGNGGIYLSTNSGIGWTQTGTTMGLVAAACSADGTNVMALGSVLYSSTNSGSTWTQSGAANNYWSSLAVSADGTKLVAATALGKGVYVSTNSGATWTQNAAPNRNWFQIVSSADGSKLAGVDLSGINSGIYTSTNSGSTWISNSLPTGYWRGAAISADGSRLAAVATNGFIFTSTNFGVAWRSNSVPTNRWSAVASSADGCKLVATDNGGGIYTWYGPPTPSLRLATSNNLLRLSWAVASTNFVVQQISNLTKVNWVKLTNSPVLRFSDLQYQIVLPMTNSLGFYRLKTP